jgi:hypothetical protein
VLDANLNGAKRIAGESREDTKQKIKEFLIDRFTDKTLIEENKKLNSKITELENKIKNAIVELQ